MSRSDIVKKLYTESRAFIFKENYKNDTVVFKEVKLNDKLRCDIMAISYDETVTIMELKTCKEDFKHDNKWDKYLDYCDYFYFFCPDNVISVNDIGDKAGLIYLTDNGFKIIRESKKLNPKYINNSWIRHIFKKLAFRKYAIFNGNPVSIDDEDFFF